MAGQFRKVDRSAAHLRGSSNQSLPQPLRIPIDAPDCSGRRPPLASRSSNRVDLSTIPCKRRQQQPVRRADSVKHGVVLSCVATVAAADVGLHVPLTPRQAEVDDVPTGRRIATGPHVVKLVRRFVDDASRDESMCGRLG